MEIPKTILLLFCITCHSFATEHSHIIPVENYESELQDLGSHVESHHPPAKVIKITKTVAVKIPVPYPVKVIEKVPYPVHISKPYPVPVPHIVHVPKSEENHQEHQAPLNIPFQYQPNQRHYEEGPLSSYNGNEEHNQFYGGSDDGHSAEAPSGKEEYLSGYKKT